jgi:hypothetical protein
MSQLINSIKVGPSSSGIGENVAPRIARHGQDFDSMIRFGSQEFEIIKKMSSSGILNDSKFGQLMNLQRVINEYSLKINMVSKIAEALTTTIRKFQQQ